MGDEITGIAYERQDGDLDAIAALSTTTFGRGTLELLNQAAALTYIGAEPALGNPGTNGYILSSTTSGVRSWIAPSAGGGTGDNPSSSVGLSAVNGVASTFMRSDGAPPLNVAIIPTWTGSHTFLQTALGVVTNAQVILSNTTLALTGAQQVSPSIRFSGQGFKSNATSASQPVDFQIYALPIQGAAAASVNLVFQARINGGAYVNCLTITSLGAASFSGSIFVVGAGTISGPTTLSGSLTTALVTKTAAYTITTTDHKILVDSTSGAITITLPTAVGVTGREYYIKDWKGTAVTNNITIATTSSQTIDGSTTKVLITNYSSIMITSDGANWSII